MRNLFRVFLVFFFLPLISVEIEPIVLLGGGIGSLTSAIYLGRAGLSPIVIEGPMPGGLFDSVPLSAKLAGRDGNQRDGAC